MQTISNHSHKISFTTTVAIRTLQRLFVCMIAFLCLGSGLTIAAKSAPSIKNINQYSVQTDKFQKASSYLLKTTNDAESIWFYESIVEEDDEYKNLTGIEFKSSLLNERICLELFFSSYLRTRLQQLNLQKQAHPFVSYFVLYHSWKSHLA